MLNAINNREFIASGIVIEGKADTNRIEEMAQSQNLSTLKEFMEMQARMVEYTSPTQEFKAKYARACMSFLAWDLAFNAKFDGNVQGWALAACGILPKKFKDFEFMADEIAIFSKAYVNYYASHVAK